MRFVFGQRLPVGSKSSLKRQSWNIISSCWGELVRQYSPKAHNEASIYPLCFPYTFPNALTHYDGDTGVTCRDPCSELGPLPYIYAYVSWFSKILLREEPRMLRMEGWYQSSMWLGPALGYELKVAVVPDLRCLRFALSYICEFTHAIQKSLVGTGWAITRANFTPDSRLLSDTNRRPTLYLMSLNNSSEFLAIATLLHTATWLANSFNIPNGVRIDS